jgi:hypothetical protein
VILYKYIHSHVDRLKNDTQDTVVRTYIRVYTYMHVLYVLA